MATLHLPGTLAAVFSDVIQTPAAGAATESGLASSDDNLVEIRHCTDLSASSNERHRRLSGQWNGFVNNINYLVSHFQHAMYISCQIGIYFTF